MPKISSFWVKMYFTEFCGHYTGMTPEQIVADVVASQKTFLEVLNNGEYKPIPGTFAERMITKAEERLSNVAPKRSEAGKIGMANRWGKKKDGEATGEGVEETQVTEKPKKTRKPEEPRNAYGKFGNVYLTDTQYTQVMAEIPNATALIDRMSAYLSQYGKRYKDYRAALFNWYKMDQERAVQHQVQQPRPQQNHKSFAQQDEDRRSKNLWSSHGQEFLEMGLEPPEDLITK